MPSAIPVSIAYLDQEDGALGELPRGNRTDRHTHRSGKPRDELLVDHLQCAVGLHCELADIARFVGPAESLIGHASLEQGIEAFNKEIGE